MTLKFGYTGAGRDMYHAVLRYLHDSKIEYSFVKSRDEWNVTLIDVPVFSSEQEEVIATLTDPLQYWDIYWS